MAPNRPNPQGGSDHSSPAGAQSAGARIRSTELIGSSAGATNSVGATATAGAQAEFSHTGNSVRGDFGPLPAEVLASGCPECGFPLSIRTWLGTADCLRCQLSIDLEESVLPWPVATVPAAPAARSNPVEPPLTPPRTTSPTLLPERPPGAKVPVTAPVPPATPAPRPHVVPARPAPVEAPALAVLAFPVAAALPVPLDWSRIKPSETPLARKRGWLDWWSHLPAWLISLILHLLAMILLGLMQWEEPVDDVIVLALNVGPQDRAGAVQLTPSPDATEFEEPGTSQDRKPDEVHDPGLPNLDESPPQADLLARQMPPANIRLPQQQLVAAVNRPGADRMVAGRDPRLRKAVVAAEGGTDYTEAAVARGLFWLARHQNEDGSWSLDDFHSRSACHGTCSGAGQVHSDTGGTSLALLAFLGAGQTHLYGQYKSTVENGIRWLLAHQEPDGDLRGRGDGRMYAHGQCTIVLCEALALTQDKELLGAPCQRAVQFVLDAQHQAGGWRYAPREYGDTSVFGWQLMALQSARQAGFRVPEVSLEAASYYLNSAQTDDLGGRYGYQPGHSETPAMTAEAALCRQYLGWTPAHPGLRSASDYLWEESPPDQSQANIYYWYYATQFMHHMGGPEWRRWNLRMRAVLVDMQEKAGDEAGSWAPELFPDFHAGGGAGGRIYTTSLAVCTLETYYRHLPLFRGVEVAEQAK